MKGPRSGGALYNPRSEGALYSRYIVARDYLPSACQAIL